MYTSIINFIKFNIFQILSSGNGSIAESLSADESLSVLVSDLLKKVVCRKVLLKKNCLQRHKNKKNCLQRKISDPTLPPEK